MKKKKTFSNSGDGIKCVNIPGGSIRADPWFLMPEGKWEWGKRKVF